MRQLNPDQDALRALDTMGAADPVAATYELDSAGLLVGGDRNPRPVLDRLTFSRPVGVAFSKHGGVLAEVCPGCGAPIAVDETGRCRHCGIEVILRNRDWVLSEVATRPQMD